MPQIRTIAGKYMGDKEAQKIAKKAVTTILSALPEELQTGDVVSYILDEAKEILTKSIKSLPKPLAGTTATP